jgi:hypothetical protein
MKADVTYWFEHGITAVPEIKAISKMGTRTFAEPALRLRG